MLKEAIATGNTIEDAMAAAKAELSAPEDADVQIEVISLPQKKTFGLFGGSKAKVRAFYEIEIKPEPAKTVQAEKPKHIEKPVIQQRPAKTQAADKPSQTKKHENIQKSENKQADTKVAIDDSKDKNFTEVPLSSIDNIISYLTTILNALGLETAKIKAKTKDEELFLQIDSEEDYGILIGRRGETLDSVQYLVRLYANRTNQEYKRISLNVGNYREKRENNLKQLANRTASKVLRYGRQTSLEPMNPYERRLIHTAVQNIKGVTSFSVGSESERRVIIALADSQRSANRSNNKGYSKNPPYNRNRNNNLKSPDQKNTSSKDTLEKRTAAKDAASVSLYGKIEPKK